jgi:hypothetical protein
LHSEAYDVFISFALPPGGYVVITFLLEADEAARA